MKILRTGTFTSFKRFAKGFAIWLLFVVNLVLLFPVQAQNPTRPVEDAIKTVKSIRHEVVKRGNHTEELPTSEYVVVGVFKSRDNANHFSNGLRSLNFKTNLGYLTEKKLWYVYLLKTNNIERARAEQARVSKMFLLRDAFLLTVNAD